MTHIEAMKQALEALEKCSAQLTRLGYSANHADQVIPTLRTAIHATELREQAEFDAAHEALEKQAGIHVSQQPAPVQEPVATVGSLNEYRARELVSRGFALTDPLFTTPPAAQPARVKVWEADGYDALMKEMQMVKARNIRQHAEIERLSALVRAQQITIDKLEAQRPVAEPHKWVGLMGEIRVFDNNVIITTKNKEMAYQLCGELLRKKNGGQA